MVAGLQNPTPWSHGFETRVMVALVHGFFKKILLIVKLVMGFIKMLIRVLSLLSIYPSDVMEQPLRAHSSLRSLIDYSICSIALFKTHDSLMDLYQLYIYFSLDLIITLKLSYLTTLKDINL